MVMTAMPETPALSRGLPVALLSALSAPVFHPVIFVWLDWPVAPVRAHSATGALHWGGQLWQGLGGVGGISLPGEDLGGIATAEAEVTLVAGPEAFDAYLDDRIRNRAASIWIGCLDARPGAPGAALVSEPVAAFHGTMDRLALALRPTEGGVQSEVTVGLATGPGARSRASAYHSDESQRRAYPDDTAGRLPIAMLARRAAMTFPES